ncbi:bifunctional UDP-N-acetylglucosamine diphosphorylase/glucosamine-1-phosphate N-acetyltransferase GlmU [Parvularcula sp. LCG005]|uniref:bifunctional UDP-N-acetylglucosamine diphosphorylase/glucosamine-1-phosphate N-acetyltransferase GlmU n=1 Tax=Parvularcula sp. LCG005 TaxID=3078805 RepID=UPI0029428CC4|nr:bifunctional UDP-N-acetylglucosamine diphosphorylase/glucosamine-1-phosphate N-acetyltransferase GlmU [Parvularcula sp. LCG005]WOI52545.1 bifunctional UDP-N-acetylglucosamine diphosphorylase/glucosamine-1-phosphate N-acetyltransferase GlmU [Parvularcula sp. LCG005]
MTQIASVILAAGHGTRMRSALPKVLHEVGRRPMLHHVMASAAQLGARRQVVVIGSQAPQVGEAARHFDGDAHVAVQDPPQGTADAVTAAMPSLEGFDGVVLVLYADTPLVTEQTLRAMIGAITAGATLAVLGFEPDEPGAYGRLIKNVDGGLDRIVEAKEASAAELAVRLCNSGVMAVSSDALRRYLPQIDNRNAKGEYYLTDLAGLVTSNGGRADIVTGSADEVYGVNDRVELAVAENIFQTRVRGDAMREGVTLLDPSTVYFAADTKIGADTVVAQNVVFGPGVVIDANVRIEAFSHLEDCHVASGATIGPYARLRPGSDVGKGARVGNFVEMKKATLGAGAKVNHLSYIGDATVGAGANIGAGTITCNYDGYGKYKTTIGENAFIGSNSALVAPVKIGRGAIVGSGSVVTEDVADDALALGRGRQVEKPGWAQSFRQRHQTKDE